VPRWKSVISFRDGSPATLHRVEDGGKGRDLVATQSFNSRPDGLYLCRFTIARGEKTKI
jgi:hypothetical protein